MTAMVLDEVLPENEPNFVVTRPNKAPKTTNYLLFCKKGVSQLKLSTFLESRHTDGHTILQTRRPK